jgi:hypothetical protein
MPREQINAPRWRGANERPPRRTSADGTSTPPGDGFQGPEYLSEPLVHLNWTKAAAGGHVQMSMEMDGATIRHLVEADPDAETYTMYTDVLNRDSLNRLILVTRQARDQAYGKDQ